MQIQPPRPSQDPASWMARLSPKRFWLVVVTLLGIAGVAIVLTIGGFTVTSHYFGVAIDPTGTQCSEYVFSRTPDFSAWQKLPIPRPGWRVYAEEMLFTGALDDATSITTPYGVCSDAGGNCCQELKLQEVPLPPAFAQQVVNSYMIMVLVIAGLMIVGLLAMIVATTKAGPKN